jgi:superfamily II DNA/RNA helicase
MLNFNEAGLPLQLQQSLERMQFTTPTPIQAAAIPPALEGKDILGSAQTGTGKTLAFGIPLIARLLNNPRGTALILTPTRELASQVLEALEKLIGNNHNLKSALLIGGDSMYKQIGKLRSRPRLIVGTPGRINDHLERGTLMLHETCFLVLDETDRMLDMGFSVQLDRIAKFLTAEQRQTLLFSATMPDNIMKLAGKYLKDPVRISVGSVRAAAPKIKQEVINTTEADKYAKLLEQLDQRTGSIIIFVKTKMGAARMAEKLNRSKHSADAIHGDLQQNRRERVINAFRKQQYRIMVATDVVSRGLDIPHIEHVINYDLPQVPEDYIHRIGRTARAGAEGSAVCLITSQDRGKWNAIQRLMNPNEKYDAPTAGNSGGGSRGGNGYGSRNAGGSSRRDGERRGNGGFKSYGNRNNEVRGGDSREARGYDASRDDFKSRDARPNRGGNESRGYNADRDDFRSRDTRREDSRSTNSYRSTEFKGNDSRAGEARGYDANRDDFRSRDARPDNRSGDSRREEFRGGEKRGFDTKTNTPRNYGPRKEFRGNDSRGEFKGRDSRGNDSRGNDSRGNERRGNETRSFGGKPVRKDENRSFGGKREGGRRFSKPTRAA